MSEEPVLRPAARILVLDAMDRVLLFRYPALETHEAPWATPGGGLEPGETHREAALRELAEEMGLVGIELGPEIWFREEVFRWGGRLLRQQERFFLARVTSYELPASVRAVHERDGISRYSWWSLDELEATSENIFPTRLAALLRALLAEGPRGEPFDIGV